jgi:hypothetical protein
MTCDASPGVCQLCYGMDLSTGAMVDQGMAVGIIAAQSLGESVSHFRTQAPGISCIDNREVESTDTTATINRPKGYLDAAEAIWRLTELIESNPRLHQIQDVYRAQRIEIDDKHIEIIIAQISDGIPRQRRRPTR